MTRKHIIIVAKFVAWKLVSLLTSFEVAICLIAKPFFYKMGKRKAMPTFNRSNMKRVLVIRRDEIGDAVMNTPFLRELRHNLPDAEITLLVKPVAYNLMQLCPYVNEVLTYDYTRCHPWQLRHIGKSLQFAWLHLWKRRFDIAIIPRWDTDHSSATFLAYFSGIPWRLGYSENVNIDKKQLNRSFDRLLTHVLQDSSLKHEVEHNMDVLRLLGFEIHDDSLEVWLGKEDEAFANEIFEEHGVHPNDLIVGIGPSGGNSVLKQWPVERFAKLGRWLQAEYNARLIIVGGPDEKQMGLKIENMLGHTAINMVGKTTLRQMAALLKQCDFYLCNDTGPMHIATAVGVPVIALFGSSCPHRFRPWGDNYKVINVELPCSPCLQQGHPDRCMFCIYDHPRCISSITVEQVQKVISEKFHPIRSFPNQSQSRIKKDTTQ